MDTSGFEKGFQSAKQQLEIFKDKSNSLNTRLQGLSSGLTILGGNLTKNAALPLAGLATVVVNTAGKFESSMSQVQATLAISRDNMSELNGETVNTMDSLESLARQLASSTKFSATEAAEAINNMAMAGYDVQEIYDTLPQVLSLASAGCLDLDYATQLVANGLNVMNKDTDSAQEFVDKLATTASNAYGSVSDFGEAVLIAGGQCSLANLSITDTFTALGILGDNGISASEGGTMLRNTLKNLYTPTSDAAKALDELGVKTADADGNLRPFQSVLQDLSKAMDGLTEEDKITAMSRIFDTRTIAGANALLKDCGDRWDELAEKIDNADGAAEQMAETQLDNLPGQLTILKSALEEVAIAFGDLMLPAIKDVIKVIQEFVGWINNLTEGQKDAIVKIAEIAAVVGPILVVVGKVVGVIGKLVGLFTGAVSPIGLVVAAIGLLIGAFVYLWNTSEDFRNFWINLWDGIKQIVSDAVDKIKDIWSKLSDFFSNVWDSFVQTLQPAIDSVKNAFEAAWEYIKTVWDLLKPYFEALAEGLVLIWELFTAQLQLLWDQIKIAAETEWNIIKDIIVFAWEAVKAVWDIAISYFSTLWDTVAGIFSVASSVLQGDFAGAWQAIQDVFASWTDFFAGLWEDLVNIFSAAVDLGQNLVNDIIQGISNAWSNLVSWFQGLWDSLFGNLSVGVSVAGHSHSSGSFATGIDYIPSDRYVKVHEGEAILSKEQNQNRKNSVNGSFSVPIVLDVTNKIDGMTLARNQYKYNLIVDENHGPKLIKT